MSKTVEPNTIWNRLIQDPAFLNQYTSEIRDLLRPFIMRVPEILGVELLASQATTRTLWQARLLFYRYLVVHGFVDQAAELIQIQPARLKADFDTLLQQLELLHRQSRKEPFHQDATIAAILRVSPVEIVGYWNYTDK